MAKLALRTDTLREAGQRSSFESAKGSERTIRPASCAQTLAACTELAFSPSGAFVMPVYVDDMQAKYGRMVMCHMIADTDLELHAMASHIGVARRWHQAPPLHRSHYDICRSKKELAIAAGAIPITWRQTAMMTARRHATGELGTPAEAETWFHTRPRTGKTSGESG